MALPVGVGAVKVVQPEVIGVTRVGAGFLLRAQQRQPGAALPDDAEARAGSTEAPHGNVAGLGSGWPGVRTGQAQTGEKRSGKGPAPHCSNIPLRSR